jgi:hypothetical protein
MTYKPCKQVQQKRNLKPGTTYLDQAFLTLGVIFAHKSHLSSYYIAHYGPSSKL